MAGPSHELPHDTLSEKAFIGCLLIDSNSWDEIADLKLSKDDFYNRRCGIILESIRDLIDGNAPVDYVSVHSKLNEKGQLESVGGQSFLTEIVEDQASSVNIHHYGKIVKDKSSLRKIIKTAQRVIELGKGHQGNVDEFMQEVESTFFKLTNEAKTGRIEKLSSFLKENLKEIHSQEGIRGIPTGYHTLDELLLGMLPGQLIVLAARPAMGKTSLALNIALHACQYNTLPVAVFSLEMMANELSMRLLTGQAKVDAKKVRRRELSGQDLPNLINAVEQLSTLPIYINDSGSVTISDIQSQCRKIKAEQEIGLVVIDYLQLMGSVDRSLPREQQISEMSRGLKNMAKELECPVLALSQLNRAVESRPNKRPNIADLRESGAIEQDADVVMFVYRDEVYNQDTRDPGIAEIIIGKNRSGETGFTKLKWCGTYTSFENLSYKETPRSFENLSYQETPPQIH